LKEVSVATARALSRTVLADQVKDRILEGILSGEYHPDARIVETQVARELNTSQAPVREALRALEALGFVEITPFKGARLRRPTRREILEAYAIRSALESLGARSAVPRMTQADVDELAGYCEAMQTAARVGDGRGVAEADAKFHGRLLELADNRTLQKVWRSLEPFLRTYITLVLPGADPRWSADLHVPILAALKRRQTEEVVAALERHFVKAGANMARRWPDGELPEFATTPETTAAPANRVALER
jgi:DNA-binding GntR family transcriptional regulator